MRDDAVDVIYLLADDEAGRESELYAWLSEVVGMTDLEIRQAGFDCIPEENDYE